MAARSVHRASCGRPAGRAIQRQRAQLHRTHIVSIEKCERNVSIDNVDRLASALLVTRRDRLKP